MDTAWHFSIIYFYPYSIDSIALGTILSLKAILITYMIMVSIFNVNWIQWIDANSRRFVGSVGLISESRMLLLTAMLLILAVISWYQVADIGFANVFGDPRRAWAGRVLSTSDHIFQLIAIVLSIVIAVRSMSNLRKIRVWLLYVATLFAYWLPYVLIGARKELFIVTIAILMAYWSSYWLRYVVTILVAFFFVMPWLINKHFVGSFHEFILPQCFLFSLIEFPALLTNYNYNYFIGSWLMLPKFLRLIEVRDMGSSFAELNLTNVGIGAHPMAEAYLNSVEWSSILFVLATVILIMGVYMLSRWDSGFAMLGIPYILIWGRSDLWVTLFFIFYGGILLFLLRSRVIYNELRRGFK